MLVKLGAAVFVPPTEYSHEFERHVWEFVAKRSRFEWRREEARVKNFTLRQRLLYKIYFWRYMENISPFAWRRKICRGLRRRATDLFACLIRHDQL